MGSEYKSLTVHSKKIKRDYHHPKGKHSNQNDNSRRPTKDLSNLRCYTCDEKGHFAKDCPRNKGVSQKNKKYKRRHHAHAVEDDEPSKKRIKQESEYSSSDEEYVLIYALTGNLTHGSKNWLIDSGASKHMIGFKESFVKLS